MFAQDTVRGIVTDNLNNPVESASIRIEGEGIGTISDSHGHFLMPVPDSLKKYPLKISHISYLTQELNINNIINSDSKIVLEPKIQQLKEVSITSSIRKTKWKKGGGLYLGSTHIDVLGTESGIKVKIKGKALLRQLKFNIQKCPYDSLALTIRIYQYNKQNEELGDIFFYTSKVISTINDSTKEGQEFIIPIDNGLYVEDNEIFVSIYYPVVEKNKGEMELPAYLKTGYTRKTGETKLNKRKFNQGISLQVTYLK
jgi:hypothetical protein